MSRSVIAAAVCLVVLAGCGGTTEPSAPPTSEDALTTETAAPPDVVVETTEAPTSEEPASQGPPEMPEEAREKTEAGAAAFVEHYIDLINYTGVSPQTGLLEPLAADGCKSCENHEATVAYSEEHGETLSGDIWKAADSEIVLFADDQAVIRVPVEQHAVEVLDSSGAVTDTVEQGEYVLVFDLVSGPDWLVQGIQIEES